MTSPEHVFYSAGLKALGDATHPDISQQIDLVTALYAVILDEDYVPADNQDEANLTAIISGSLWDGVFNLGICDTGAAGEPLEIGPAAQILYEIDAGQMKLILPDLDFATDFGVVTDVGTAGMGHVLVYLELDPAGDDDDRFPLLSMRSPWTPVLGDTFKFDTDPAGCALWKV